jgi:hypothetical protein
MSKDNDYVDMAEEEVISLIKERWSGISASINERLHRYHWA